MMFLIVSCLIATSVAMPAVLPSELTNDSDAQVEELKEIIQNAASILAHDASGVSNQLQSQITSLPQQISQTVLGPIQGIVKPIIENQDANQVTFAIPKPTLPSWIPSLPPSFQLPGFNNWPFSNLLRPSQGRLIPGLRSGYGGEGQNQENNDRIRQETQ